MLVCFPYSVVIINWVQYLGPPGPFSFSDSRDLLEVLGDFLGRERGGSLGDHPGPKGILPIGSLSLVCFPVIPWCFERFGALRVS